MKKLLLLMFIAMILVIPTVSAALPSDVHRWGFEQNGNDEEGISNATPIGSPTYVEDSINGTYSVSLNEGGSSDYFTVPSLSATRTEFTITAWIKPSRLATTTPMQIFAQYEAGSQGRVYFSLINRSGVQNLNMFYDSGLGGGCCYAYAALTDEQVEADDWIFVAGTTKIGGNVKAYVNENETIGQSQSSFGPEATYGYFGGFGSSYFFEGKIDEIRMWNTQLSAEEINEIYNSSLSDSSGVRPILENITLINESLGQGQNQTCDSYPCTTSDTTPTFFGNSSKNSFYRISTRGDLNWTEMNSTNNCYQGNGTDSFYCQVSEGDNLSIGDGQCVYISAVNTFSQGNQTILSTSGCLELNIVADDRPPIITLEQGNSFSSSNNSVISGLYYNVSLNVNYYDFNLFQASANVTCDTSGQIFYREELDINTSSYSLNDTVNITQIPFQRCVVNLQGSDDHTDRLVSNYFNEEVDNGIHFYTPEKNNVIITSEDKLDKVDTDKSFDRYSFKFNYDDNVMRRIYFIESDNLLFYKKDSEYDGHFVVWNEREHKGNWIDFEILNNPYTSYTINKISNNKYKVIVDVRLPKDVYLQPQKDGLFGLFGDYMSREELEKYYYGLDEVVFNSIGGTNIFSVDYEFYTGAVVNVSTYNIYDNQSFSDFNATFTAINATFLVNSSQEISGSNGLVVNISTGNYSLTFDSATFFSQTYDLILNDTIVSQNFTSYQSIVNIYGQNVKTFKLIQDLNITIYNNVTGFENLQNVTTSNITTFYLNVSNYSMNVTHVTYQSQNVSFVTTPKSNVTIKLDMNFLAAFFLYDERTLEGFNTTSADTITFFLFCPDETTTTEITNNQTFIPIGCDYDKFKFVLDYGTTGYSRTLILEPDDLGRVNVYLINLDTTDAIATTFIIDDLLQQYEDVSIYVNKIVGNTTAQITADFIDIESKMVAYLIENHEYIIEVHSNNQPTYILGDYSAAEAGQKVIRLYDSKLGPEPSGFGNDVTFNTWSDNSTGDLLAYARYNDSQDLTIKVTWTLFEDNYDGAVIYNFTTTDPNFLASVNLTPFKEKNVASLMNIEHESISTSYKLGKVINIWEKVTLGIMEYVSQASLNWAILIIMSVIAVTSNIKSANITSLLIVGLAALLSIFGWITIGAAIMAFGALVAIISIFREPKTSGGY